jgi:hypothetical protein
MLTRIVGLREKAFLYVLLTDFLIGMFIFLGNELSPESFLDRTFGSFENAVIAYQLLPQTKRILALGLSRFITPFRDLRLQQLESD